MKTFTKGDSQFSWNPRTGEAKCVSVVHTLRRSFEVTYRGFSKSEPRTPEDWNLMGDTWCVVAERDIPTKSPRRKVAA